MDIKPDQFEVIWRSIGFWMKERRMRIGDFIGLLRPFQTGYNRERVENGLNNQNENLTSDFIHACVAIFGFQFRRGAEDDVEVLSDEECITILTAPFRERPSQSRLFD